MKFTPSKSPVKSGDLPLRITMVYSDYPGPTLVNNLNLMLTAPDGTRHVGNQKPGNLMTMDVTNNVEVINIDNPLSGNWLIDIVASNVSQGPQDFALVYSANIGAATPENNIIHASEEPMLPIPDRNFDGVSNSIMIADNGIISSLKVGVDIQHSYIGDLTVTLAGPEQSSVILHNRTGASSNDVIKVYDMQNTSALTTFHNTSVKGEWKLTVSDKHNGTRVSYVNGVWNLLCLPVQKLKKLHHRLSPFLITIKTEYQIQSTSPSLVWSNKFWYQLILLTPGSQI